MTRWYDYMNSGWLPRPLREYGSYESCMDGISSNWRQRPELEGACQIVPGSDIPTPPTEPPIELPIEPPTEGKIDPKIIILAVIAFILILRR